FVAFVFTGGCIAPVLLFCRRLWSRAAIVCGLLFAVTAALVLNHASKLGSFSLPSIQTTHLLFAIQLSLWGTVGVSLIILAVLDLVHQPDTESLFLFMWIIGTFLFAGFINWTTNGRSVLPMIVPAGIIIVRRLEQQAEQRGNKTSSAPFAPLLIAAVLAFAVAWADTAFAETARTGAMNAHESYGTRKTVWFLGHWGFQYYMQELGGKPVDVNEFRPTIGDVVVVPETNTNLFAMPAGWPVRRIFEIPTTTWISTMNYQLGAG